MSLGLSFDQKKDGLCVWKTYLKTVIIFATSIHFRLNECPAVLLQI